MQMFLNSKPLHPSHNEPSTKGFNNHRASVIASKNLKNFPREKVKAATLRGNDNNSLKASELFSKPRKSNITNRDTLLEGSLSLSNKKSKHKPNALSLTKLEPLDRICSLSSRKGDGNVLITSVKNGIGCDRLKDNSSAIQTFKQKDVKNKASLRTAKKKSKAKPRVSSANGVRKTTKVSAKRSNSAKPTATALEPPNTSPKPAKRKLTFASQPERKPAKQYAEIEERLREYRKRHIRMVTLVDEYKEYFNEKQQNAMEGKKQKQLERYLDNAKGVIDNFKKEKTLRKIGAMLGEGRTEEIKKFIQVEFEVKKARKRITVRKSHPKDSLNKVIRLLSSVEREHYKEVNNN
eukprot:TRINITY_DN1976_c0_g4_i1.p1 TRINITY_DN1976_c0_g4~~TRINITY_DN1976_c0_g4_i1.p1  ORF type:complete len:350 (+),score=66.65 TRINITY_DN1976_c0_g4_i1:107-1156(+)